MTTDTQLKLRYIFPDLHALKRAYMPFVVDGAIFIPTDETVALNDLMTVSIVLPESQYEYTFTGEIIWISPKSSELPGIGVTCSDDEGREFNKVVRELISELKGDEKEFFDTM